MQVLFVSENKNQVSLVKRILNAEGVDVVHIPSGEEVKTTLLEQDCLAIVLDFPELTEEDFAFWKELRQSTYLPVMILSSESADPKGILARQQATLQLAEPLLKLLQTLHEASVGPDRFENSSVRLAENVYIDIVRRTIIRDGKVIKLTEREFDLLFITGFPP